MVIWLTFALLIAILSLPYCFFKSSRFIKFNSIFVRLKQSTQKPLDIHLFISNVLDIPQQFQELICILFHGLLSQSQLMELLNFVIIIPVREVFLLEILLELFPLKSCCRLTHTWVTWQKSSSHSVCPWGQVSSQGCHLVLDSSV